MPTVEQVVKKLGMTVQIVLPLAKRIRRSADGPGKAAQRPGEGKCEAQEAAGQGGAGQGDSEGGGDGKLISPAKRRRELRWAGTVSQKEGPAGCWDNPDRLSVALGMCRMTKLGW